MVTSTKVVAVVGASTDRQKFGNKALRAFAHRGYDVIPVNPHHSAVEGLQCFPSVLDVPRRIDMATIYVPPHVGERIIEEVARKNISEVWLNPGAESHVLVARARRLGIEPVLACSIVAIGERPDDYQ
jgi:predicted CoA-binding protein